MTAPRRPALTIRRLMVVVAAVAMLFAVLSPEAACVLVPPLLIGAACRTGSQWARMEVVGAMTWALGAAFAFSDVFVDFRHIFLLFVSGAALGSSWIIRLALGRMRPRSVGAWAGCLVTPACGLLGVLLLETDLDFRLRLALSTPALEAEARRVLASPRGTRQPEARRLGLIVPLRTEERGGCILWTTGYLFLSSGGLAYVPTPMPPSWPAYRFWHVSGPFWRFIWDD